ncbi:MAG: iron-sulfur cluster assembly accessory protein [Thermoanaerobaculia bacterium]|nr:iron-sulfur cluster assembly accessory protein [Thermoanaerobaculia bacterium]
MEQNEQTTQPTSPDEPAGPPADGVPDSADHPVEMTSKAVQMVKLTRQEEGMDDSFGLRVAVVGGGCSGFQYALDFTDEARDNDFVYEVEGLTVYVDALSARYLQGTRIDYVMGMAGAGFKFENPKAVGSCGCGSSFAV